MIREDFDRSGYIGGSDANYVLVNWNTATFKKWWNQKVTAINSINIDNVYTIVGTILESEIMDYLGIDKLHRDLYIH